MTESIILLIIRLGQEAYDALAIFLLKINTSNFIKKYHTTLRQDCQCGKS
nr:MAG TPA: hypothetical protein [Caudoviricetes sp.]